MDKNQYRRERESPSFSSTLLDSIYRSIDEGNGHEAQEELVLYRETMRKKHSNCTAGAGGFGFQNEEDMASLKRACMIEKWMEKKVSEKVVFRRKSLVDFERKSQNDRSDLFFLNSSSSSSDSSSGGGFSSSEAESVYGVSSRSWGYTVHRPKPIRTSVSVEPEKFHRHEKELNGFSNRQQNYQEMRNNNSYVGPQQNPKHEGGFGKTKSRALKIYGDLKKVKQPISPGGRLANFLNSLFTVGKLNAKKLKISSIDDETSSDRRKSKSGHIHSHASTCTSASSYSRSCLSKTPSSRGKLSNGTKRSVRFYPVSVIVDGDCQPCGHKSLYGDHEEGHGNGNGANFQAAAKMMDEELKFHLMEKNRRVEEAARELLKNYQKKVECEFDAIRNSSAHNNNDEMLEDDDEEDDDAASYASSDLFELDNLSTIGIERFREELPVYETTHLDTNRAISNGLFL